MERKAALETLTSMFPNFDTEVLSTVLSSTAYDLELTIESLFEMNSEAIPVGSSLADENSKEDPVESELPEVQLSNDFLELEHSASHETVDEMMAAYLQMREVDHAQNRKDMDEAIWQSIQESRKKQKKPPLGTRFKDKLKNFFSRKKKEAPEVKRQVSQVEELKKDKEEDIKQHAEPLDDDYELISFEHTHSAPGIQRYLDPFEEQKNLLNFTQIKK